MATMTIAQALASTATGITVADTPANIAAAASNSALVARVTLFTMKANAASTVAQAKLLYSLGAKFSHGVYVYTIRDTVAALTDQSAQSALTIASGISVFDTASNLLAALGTPLMQHAASTLLSISATVTVANLLRLEALPSFSVLPGQTITLADSAANLLAMSASANRPTIKVFQVVSDATVTLTQAQTLAAKPGFAVVNGATLTVGGTAASMTTISAQTILSNVGKVGGVAVVVTDALKNVLSSVSGLVTASQSAPRFSVVMTSDATASAAQLSQLLPLFGKFTVALGKKLTVADSAVNLLTISANGISMVQATQLSQSTNVSTDQLVSLTAMPGFALGSGVALSVTGTLAGLSALTQTQLAFISNDTVQDTVSHLIAAASVPVHTTTIVAQVDMPQYTAAQAAQLALLATNGVTLTVVATPAATSLVIADTLQNIASYAANLIGVIGHGPVVVSPTNSNVELSSAQALALIGLNVINLAIYGVSVADTGAAITSAAAQLFGHGLVAITVNSGVFSGTLAQLLDPTLNFAGTSGPYTLTLTGAFTSGVITPSAQLSSSAIVGTSQLIALSLLPGFSLRPGVSLTVQDTTANLATTAAIVDTYATDVTVTDSATVTAAQASALAGIRQILGGTHFNMAGHQLTISDSAAALSDPANAAGVALATSVTLASDSVASAAQAGRLVDLGSAFLLGGHGLTVIDTAAALAMLAANGTWRAGVNAWAGQVVLSADAVLSVAAVQGLQQFAGFSAGNHHLTVADTASNLLAPGVAGALVAASSIQLSASATLSVSDATTVVSLHDYMSGANQLTVADTPAHLAGLTAQAAAFATTETFVAQTIGNASDFTISVAQLAALQSLSGLSTASLIGTITVSDTATALVALAPALTSTIPGSLLAHVVVALSADAITSAASAATLASLPGFSLAGHALTVHDSPSALLSPGAGAGFALAAAVGIDAPVTVTVAIATALAAIQNFGADAFALTISDTPAHLAGLSPAVASLATSVTVIAPSGQPVEDYTVSVAQYEAIAGLQHVSFAGFSGTITVLDTASNLIGLAAAIATAPVGSPLAIARGATAVGLLGDATVSAAGLAAIAMLPSVSLNGHWLAVQDTPAALLAAFPGIVPLATSVTLASNGTPWVVTAADAAHLAAIPGFTPGSAGMAVVDTAAHILVPQNGAGLADAGSVVLSADATVSAADAVHLAALGNFSTGSAQLTIQDRAGALAALSPSEAALASSIVLQGSGLVSVAQFTALRALPALTIQGGMLVVVDSATNLAALAGTSTSLASLIVLDSNATLTADQAEVLATLPHFSPGASQIFVVDSAANLLHISGAGPQPDDWAGELIATTVTLSADATVSAGQAAEFGMLGARFSLGGHVLTISDTAASLLSPSNAVGLGVASNVVLGSSATLSAAQAGQLAAIAGITLGPSVALTVQDSVANLIGLSAAAKALGTAELLPNGVVVTVTAQDAALLAALPHFSNAGATVTVSDTITNLQGYIGWQAVATSYVVTDTLANLAGSASNPLLTLASSVAPLSGGDIGAATAVLLASIPSFHRGSIPITVTDTPAQIASAAIAIGQIGATARVDATIAIATSQADALAGLNTAGLLAFVPGISLSIQDSYVNLTDPTHAAALALASSATVFDSLGNVLTASAHGWGALAMSYALSSGGTINGSQADSLAGRGASFHLNGQTLVMADTAAGVLGHATALSILGITTQVSDTTANVVAAVSGLIARGDRLISVTLTDATSITAAQADALQYLAPVLAGYALRVNDTAVAIGQNLPNLLALGMHLGSVTVTDQAANVAPWVSTILSLGPLLQVSLTDVVSTSAASAAAMVPLMPYLPPGTSLGVLDTGAAIASNAFDLATLGTLLGTIGLSDGTTVTAGVAAGLVLVASHLGMSVLLDVVDTAAALVSFASPITFLRSNGQINTLVASNDTASNVIAAAIDLVTLGATATVRDSSSDVLAVLDTLQAWSGTLISAITLTDPGLPALTMSVDRLRNDHGALALITSPFTVAISDTSANIQSDLASGSSTLVGSLQMLGYIIASDMGGITLTEARAVASGVADSIYSVMHRFSGGIFTVTDVLVSQVGAVAGLAVAPSSIVVSDTAAHIQADLVSGSSQLLAHRFMLTALVVTDGGTITLTDAQVRAAHVDDGAGSILSIMSGETLVVTNVPVADITAIFGLGVAPSSISVMDTAAAIQADIAMGGSGRTVSNIAQITAIVATGGTITLTEPQVVAAGINDGPGSVFSKLTGATLAVTQVPVGDIVAIASLSVAPAAINVSDTAAHIAADLTAGVSNILSHLGLVTGIVVSDAGTIFLNTAQAAASGVDDGPSSALARMSGETFVISGASVADLAIIDGFTVTPNRVSVADVASSIQSDLASGLSQLVSHNLLIPTFTVTDAGTITLTTAQAAASGVDDGVGSVLAKMVGGTLAISGAAIADFTTLDGLTVHAQQISISDTLADVQADLASNTSKLLAHVAALGTVAMTDSGTATLVLSVSQLSADLGVLAKISTPFQVSVLDTAVQVQADLASGSSVLRAHLGLVSTIVLSDGSTPSITLTVAQLAASTSVLADIATMYRVLVNDTAAHVESDLAAGSGSAIQSVLGMLGGIFLPGGSVLHLTAGQALYAELALDVTTGLAGLAVSGATVSQVSAVVGLGLTGTTIAVLDSASDVQADLASGTSVLVSHASILSSIALTDSSTPPIELSVARLAAASTVLSHVVSSYLLSISDTALNVQTDLAGGAGSTILGHLAEIGWVALSSGNTITLTGAQATYPNVGSTLAHIAGLTTLSITAAALTQSATVIALAIPGTTIVLSDTAANVQADLTGGSSVLLAHTGAFTGIQLSDSATPHITLSLAEFTSDAAVLALITSPYNVTISDTALAVQADLQLGGSIILGNPSLIDTIALPGGSTITLSASEALVSGVSTALTNTSGLASFVVTGASVGQIVSILALGVANTSLRVSDSASNVQADLGIGPSSIILSHASDIAQLALSTPGAITLTAIQANVTGVANVLSTMTNLTGLTVTSALVSDVPGIIGLAVPNTTINVADFASAIQADLMSGASYLLANVANLGALALTDGSTPTITLDVAHLGSDGAVLVLIAPSSYDLVVADTAAVVQTDLSASGSSVILSHYSQITGVALTPGSTITLTEAVLTSPNVIGVLLETTGLTSLRVTDTTVAQIGTVLGANITGTTIDVLDTMAAVEADLTGVSSVLVLEATSLHDIQLSDLTPPTITMTASQLALGNTVIAKISSNYSIAIDDTAANVQSDLALGAGSAILGNLSHLSGIALSFGTSITLTEAQATYSGVGTVLTETTGLSTLHVTGATVDRVASVVALGIAGTVIDVSDTAAHIQSDLSSGSPVLSIDFSWLGAIALSDGGMPTISLPLNSISADGNVLGRMSGYTLAVSDTATNVQNDLIAGASSIIIQHAIASVTLSFGTSMSLTYAQLAVTGIESVVAGINGLTSFTVTATDISQLSTVAGYTTIPGLSVDVLDSVSALQADLTGGSVLLANSGILHSIALSDPATPISLTIAQLTTDAAILGAISTGYTITIDDTASAVGNDLALGASSKLLTLGTHLGTITLTASAPISLTEAQAVHPGIAAIVDGISGRTEFDVTAVAVGQINTVFGLGVSTTKVDISDLAIHVQNDLTGGSSALLAHSANITGITLSDGSRPTITLTVAQLDADGAVLSQIAPSSYYQAISDTALNVQSDLAQGISSVILTHTISAIALTGGNAITLTDAQIGASGLNVALGMISGLNLTVTDVPVADIAAALALGVTNTTITVLDSAASVLSDLQNTPHELATNLANISQIVLSDISTPAFNLAVADLTGYSSVLTLIQSNYDIAISDSSSNVSADLAGSPSALVANAGHISGIALNDGGTPTLTLSMTTLSNSGPVLGLISSSYSLDVTGMAAEIQADLVSGSSKLVGDLAHLGTVAITDSATALVLSISQLSASASVLAHINSYAIALSDTAAAVQADLASSGMSVILGHLSSISAITLGIGTTITLTSVEASYAGVDNGPSSAIAKLASGSLIVTDVAVGDIPTILGLYVTPMHITVKDSAAQIIADIGGGAQIAAHASVISSVLTNETTLSAGDAAAIYNALHSVTTFDESALTVADTAAALLLAATNAPGMLSAAALVTMTDNPTGLSAAQATTLAGILGGVLGGAQTMSVADTPTNLLDSANGAGITLATSVTLSAPVTVTAAVATQLVALHAYQAGPAITVQDSVVNLLDPTYASGILGASTTKLNADVNVGASTLAGLAVLHGYSAGSHSLTVTDTVANILGLTQPALGFAALVAVSDTTAAVTVGVSALQAAIPGYSHPLSIHLTDASANVLAITTTATDYAANAATYASITTAGVIQVTGASAGLAAISSLLAANAAVGEVDVTDTAANILSNLTALQSIGATFKYATISDTLISAAGVSSLLQIQNLIAPNLTISDTGSQIAAALQADGAAGLTFMNAHTVTLSADSVIYASDALTLGLLTSLSKNGFHLYVWDTASHLTDSVSGYLAAVQAGIIDGVYLKATGHTATISASLASTLLSINHFSPNDPPAPSGDGLANTLTVLDTAARIDAAFATLTTQRASISGITVSASATVTDAVFGKLLSLGATMDIGKTLIVRDTAANIIANATSQLTGTPSVTPTAWQISGSASVTTAGAILLTGLSGFSIGAYTLTLTDDATVSISNANLLGTLGTALKLNGHHLDVSGTVATLSSGPGLSANAKLIVTPHISDTFANVATLTTGSGLLGGTIAVTDSSAVTVTQAASFLALLGGSGIPAANVSFAGQIESVTDTLANVLTLTGSSGWTSNVSVHGSFSLIVADTVATLANAANTSALAGMAGSTLSSSQTTTAGTAESLFALESTIHFTKGSYTLTVQDTAANLLNPANTDGVALADVLQLSADATVTASDAESLLSNSHFQLNHVLTVSDSSTNLLDGVLAGDITSGGSNIVVRLAAPETVDAATATALVNLHGFAATGLSIADGASYLLNTTNAGAEHLATHVTLSGDETLSVATIVRLVAVEHFSLDTNVLHLASNDYADAAALKVIADFASGFQADSFHISMTQDALALTPTEYTNLQSDGIVLNGHALSALPTGVNVTSGSGTVSITGMGVSGGTLNVYAGGGSSLSHSSAASASFTVTASEGSIGNGVVVTETLGGSDATGESAPIIALEQNVVTTAAGGATFASSGAVQVGVGQYVDLYTSSTVPAHPASPALVYDPSAHTLSLNVDGHAPVVLVTLGTATHPTSLTAAEIFIQHFS